MSKKSKFAIGIATAVPISLGAGIAAAAILSTNTDPRPNRRPSASTPPLTSARLASAKPVRTNSLSWLVPGQ